MGLTIRRKYLMLRNFGVDCMNRNLIGKSLVLCTFAIDCDNRIIMLIEI